MSYSNYTFTARLSQDEIAKLQILKRDTESTRNNFVQNNAQLLKKLGLSKIADLQDDEIINDISNTQRELESIIEQITARLANPVKSYNVDASYIDDAKNALQTIKRRFEGLYE